MGEAKANAKRCICPWEKNNVDPGRRITNQDCPVHGRMASIWMPPAAVPLNESELKPPPVPEPNEIDKRVLEGYSVAHLTTAGPNHWADPEPDAMAFRCPHCGAWRPPYGFSGQRAELPGYGTAELMGIFCGECKVMLQVQLINLFPPGTRGRTH